MITAAPTSNASSSPRRTKKKLLAQQKQQYGEKKNIFFFTTCLISLTLFAAAVAMYLINTLSSLEDSLQMRNSITSSTSTTDSTSMKEGTSSSNNRRRRRSGGLRKSSAQQQPQQQPQQQQQQPQPQQLQKEEEVPIIPPISLETTKSVGQFGTKSFQLYHKSYVSLWHDVPLRPAVVSHNNDDDDANSNSIYNNNIIHMVTEIPKGTTYKMELQKTVKGNPIAHDIVENGNDDTIRHYNTRNGPTMFANYGYIPQTWEDPNNRKKIESEKGGQSDYYYGGDNDPLDVMEVSGRVSSSLEMGSITPCKVIGHLELIDRGEMDYKILCIATPSSAVDDDGDLYPYDQINTIEDLRKYKPDIVEQIMNWSINYNKKTNDGDNSKPQNSSSSPAAVEVEDSMRIIEETHQRWMALCGHDSEEGTPLSALSEKAQDFALDSPNCRG